MTPSGIGAPASPSRGLADWARRPAIAALVRDHVSGGLAAAGYLPVPSPRKPEPGLAAAHRARSAPAKASNARRAASENGLLRRMGIGDTAGARWRGLCSVRVDCARATAGKPAR